MCWVARYSTMAWVMAAMWSSLKEAAKALPRWPEVPKATRWAGTGGVGVERVVGGDEARRRRRGCRGREGWPGWLVSGERDGCHASCPCGVVCRLLHYMGCELCGEMRVGLRMIRKWQGKMLVFCVEVSLKREYSQVCVFWIGIAWAG